MEYKFIMGQKVRHIKTGQEGVIRRWKTTDNGKNPAYDIKVNDGSLTRWTESNIVSNQEEPDSKSTHKYKVGDRVYRGRKGDTTYSEATITKTYLYEKDPYYSVKDLTVNISPAGWRESKIKGLVEKTNNEGKKPTEWKNGAKYRCIDADIIFGTFTKDKIYTAKYDEDAGRVKIVCDGGDTWDLYKDQNKFQEIPKEITIDDIKEGMKILLKRKDDLPRNKHGIVQIESSYVTEMDEWLGKEVTVVKVKESNFFSIKEDGDKWNYSADTVERILMNKAIPVDFSNYKKGDYITLKSYSECRKLIKNWHNDKIPDGWGINYENVATLWSNSHKIDRKISDNTVYIKTDLRGYEIPFNIVDLGTQEASPSDPWEATWGDGDPLPKEKQEYDLDISTINESNTGRIPAIQKVFANISSKDLIKEQHLVAKDPFTYRYRKIRLGKQQDTYDSTTQDKFLKLFTTDVSEWDIPPKEAEKPKDKVYIDKPIKDEIKQMLPVFPVLLEGPVGSGKTTIATEVCEELGLELLGEVMTRQTTLSMLMGYKNVNGDYIPSKLRDAYENGKFYLLEELNGGDPNTLLAINTIENGFLFFPDGKVMQHPNFRMMATMNDITNAKDFGGRSNLDKSTENRFHKIFVPANPKSRFSKESVKIASEIDKLFSKNGISSMTTNRDIMRFEHMCKDDDIEVAIQKCLVNNKTKVDIKTIEKIVKESKDWE